MTSNQTIMLATDDRNVTVNVNGVDVKTWHVGRALRYLEKHGMHIVGDDKRVKTWVTYNGVQYRAAWVLAYAVSYATKSINVERRVTGSEAANFLADLRTRHVYRR